MTSERRESRRIVFDSEINYLAEGNAYHGRCANLSADGMFIHTANPLPVKTEITIHQSFKLQDRVVPIRICGEVIRVVTDTSPEKKGMGIRFTSVVANHKEAIRFFVCELYGQDLFSEDRLRKVSQPAEEQFYSYELEHLIDSLDPEVHYPASDKGKQAKDDG